MPVPPGGQGCFFWRFFLGGAGSSPSAPCSAIAASAAASAAAFAMAAAVSLCQQHRLTNKRIASLTHVHVTTDCVL